MEPEDLRVWHANLLCCLGEVYQVHSQYMKMGIPSALCTVALDYDLLDDDFHENLSQCANIISIHPNIASNTTSLVQVSDHAAQMSPTRQGTKAAVQAKIGNFIREGSMPQLQMKLPQMQVVNNDNYCS